MQIYCANTFHIQLNNDPKVLKEFHKVYIHIQKPTKQHLFSSTKKRVNTAVSFYDEEGFIFNEDDFIEGSIQVQIHEYAIEQSDEEYEQEQEGGDKKQHNDDKFNRESLLAFSSLTLNQFSTRIYSATNPSIMIGEFIYTLKPYNNNNVIMSLKIISPVDGQPIHKSKTAQADNNSVSNSSRNNKILSSKSSSPNNLSSKASDRLCSYENTPINANTLQTHSENQQNAAKNNENNQTFIKLIQSQSQLQYQQQNYVQNEEEESTETPTSKFISSQGDLSSSRQYVPQQMSKSAALEMHTIQEQKTPLQQQYYLEVEKQKNLNEIQTPLSKNNKNTAISCNNSPRQAQETQNNTNKQQQFQQQQILLLQSQQYQQQQQQYLKQQQQQQLQTFSQYLQLQQQKNQTNQHNKYFINQNFNHAKQNSIYSPSLQQFANNVQVQGVQMGNNFQNRIATNHPQIYQNNNLIGMNQNMNQHQHRIIQQQQPNGIHMKSSQPPPIYRHSTTAGTPITFQTTPQSNSISFNYIFDSIL